MPNDPRVKFINKKKHYDASRNLVYFHASGHGGGVFGGSNFPTPPGPGPSVDPTPTIPIIPPPYDPAPIKPGLDPVGIAGITIASAIAIAAAAGLAEQERRRRANRGIPVPTDEIEMTETRRTRPNLNRGGTIVPSRQTTPRINRSTGGYALLTDNTTGPRGVPTPFTQAGFTGSGDLRTSAPGTRTPAPLGSGASTPAPVPSGTATPKIPPPTPPTPFFDALESPGFDFASITPQPPAPAPDRTPLDAQREFLNKQIAKEKIFLREGQKIMLRTKDGKVRAREFIDFDESILEDFNEVIRSNSEKIRILEGAQAKSKINLKNEPKGPGRTQAKQRLTQIEGELNYERTINPNLEGKSRLINEALSRRTLISGPKTRGQINREATFSYITSSPESGIPRTLNPTQPVGNSSANDALNASRPTSNVEMQDLTPQAHAQQTQAAAEAMLADIDALTQTPDPAAVAERNRIISPGSMEDLTLEINEMIKAQKGPGLFERTMAVANERIQRTKAATSAAIQDLQKMGSRNKILPTGSGSRTSLSGQATLERIRASGGRMSTETEMRGSSLRPRPAFEGLPEDERLEMERLRERLANVISNEMSAPVEAPVEQIANAERREPRPLPEELQGTELRDAAGLTFRNKPVDKFNNMYDLMTERWRAYYSDSIPTAPETMTDIQGKKYIMEQILKEQAANGDPITAGDTAQVEITLEEALNKVQSAYENTDPNVKSEPISKNLKPDRRRKLTKQTGLLATEEQRLRPTTLAGEAQARVQSRTSGAVETRAPAPSAATTSAATTSAATTSAATTEEVRAPTSVREQVRVLEARSAPAPELRTRVPELRATGSAPPSAPPSAPESEVATPRESAVREQTPAERATFAEELTGRLKGPARQKAKINIGKTNPNVRNPLDIFVSPQHRNIPNTELNPRAKTFKGTLTEISARVPRLVPSRSTLISMGSEGGSMVGGFAAGYFSAQAMNDYFAKHPAKNLGEQYGQALATTFVGMAVGSITQQVLSQVIRQGVNYALTGEMAAIEGAISGGGTLFLSSIGEAALFTLVGVSTQMATTRFLEDAGFNHAISRSAGSLASTGALVGTEVGLWLAKGGLLNPAGDVSFLASEAMIIGFGIYSFVSEFFEGVKQDEEEEEYQAQVAENQRLNEERQRTIDSTIKRNGARQSFMRAYERADYDFDKALALLTPEERADLGENAESTDPNGLAAFRAQVEAAFDPLLDTTLPEGYKSDPAPLSREDQLKRTTYTAYVSWYIDSMNGKNPPPFDFNSEGAKLLNDESGGTWTSAANVHATSAMTMARRTNPLIENAQKEIVDAFHKDHKTIEEMPYDVVQYADLDPSFRERYNLYIIAEAQSYIYQQYNSGGFTYNDIDPDLVAIANRDPEFRGAADFYYQTLANQSRDYNLTIQECARLNSLAANDQQIEIGKLNDARNKIIQQHQAENQEVVDRYNANIISEISAYGDNFEAIIRNINDQALLSGHTFLYAANRSDLYRQLHMEMPELELVDPDTGEGGEGGTDAPLPGPSKGRKIGDTDLYGYRYGLTDEQNKELDELARVGVFSKDPIAMQAEAERIKYRDNYLFEDTDAEKAQKENLTLDEYYKKYGITAEPQIIEWEARKGIPKEDGKYRYPDGTIVTWKNGFRVDVDTTNVVIPVITKYDPSLTTQPDGEIEMPDGSVRTYKNGLVTEVAYPANTTPSEVLTPDQINERERTPVTPVEPKQPTDPATLKQGDVTMPDGSFRTYKNGKVVYVSYPANVASGKSKFPSQINDEEGIRNADWTPEAPVVAPVEPVVDRNTLKQGRVTMPDGSTRTYIDGKVVSVQYPEGKTGPNINEINASEGVQLAKDPNARPKDFMDRFLEEQEQQLKAKNDAAAAAAAAAEAENPEPEFYVNPGANPRYIASKQEQQRTTPAPPAQAQATPATPAQATPAPGQTKGPKTAPEGVTEYRATKVQAQNALNQTRANDAAGVSNMNNEPENP